ncbi:tetratricopeptide repeat protein [Edaphocola aurantiacus]|uniref:tetratricopeptide repeat protein n=1 Tax=Edaphocola aurantiacus TaxID=2601682 RepID=UPI001C94A257|nr:tetratricopeptide repeat protein [Edaphocola aurantiacus]
MRTFITVLATAAASAVVYDVNAQSLENGKKLLSYERYSSAHTTLEPLAASSPEANYYFGLVQLGEGKVDAAKATFAKFPKDFYNQAGTARVLFTEGKGDDAMKILNEIVDGAKKKDWEKYKVAADAITYSKTATQVDQAVAWYRIAKEKKNDNAQLLIAMGDALMRQNTGASNGEATQVFDEAIKLGGANSLAYSRKGLLWLNARQYKEALENYSLAKDADKENPMPYGDLAEVYYRSGKYELAKQNIEEYLKLSDKTVQDQLRYGNILYLTQNYKEASQKYQELINKGEGEKTPTLYRGLAYAQYQDNNYVDALASFNKYRGLVKDAKEFTYEDDLYYAYVNNAMASQDTANKAKYAAVAEEYYVKALEKNTEEDKTALYRKIADGYKETKNWTKVSDWYTKLVTAYPEASPLDYFNSGYYAYFAKDFAKAKTRLEAFNAKYPQETIGYFWLARTAAAQDSEAKLGTAVEPFKTWLSKPSKEGDTRKKEDEIFAYVYLSLYYYNSNDGKTAVDYAKKTLALDANNETANQIIKYFKAKGIN